MYVLSLILKGIILGCTAIIPGISIGTIALTLNVYAPCVESFAIIATPHKWNLRSITQAFRFLAPIVIGIALAMVLLARALEYLLDQYPAFVHLTFLGIIVGSIPSLYSQHIRQYISLCRAGYVICGAAVVLFFGLSDLLFAVESTYTQNANSLHMNVVSISTALLFGTIGSACGLIPGISGSFVLLILGYYGTYLAIITSFNALIVPLLIGHAIGFVMMSVIIKRVLNVYTAQSYNVILGMIIGSCVAIFPWQLSSGITSSSTRIIIACACILSGSMLTYVLGHISTTRSPQST